MKTTQRRCDCGGVRTFEATACQRCRAKGYNDTKLRDMAAEYGVSVRVVNKAGGYERLMALDEDVRRLLLGVGNA